MRPLRVAASALVVAAGVAAFYWFVAIPFASNVTEHEVKMRSDRAMRYGSPMFMLPLARHNLQDIAAYRDRYPTVNLLMLEGWNRAMATDYAGAERSYEQAIAMGPRAETLVELGLAQINEGKPDAAFRNFLTAAAFDKSYVLDLPYPDLERRLLDAIEKGTGYEDVMREREKDCAR